MVPISRVYKWPTEAKCTRVLAALIKEIHAFLTN